MGRRRRDGGGGGIVGCAQELFISFTVHAPGMRFSCACAIQYIYMLVNVGGKRICDKIINKYFRLRMSIYLQINRLAPLKMEYSGPLPCRTDGWRRLISGSLSSLLRVTSRHRRSHWVRRPSAVVCMFLILHTQCSKNTLRNAFHSLCTEWYAPLGAPIPKTTAPKSIPLRRLLVLMDLINRNNLFFQHQPVSCAHTGNPLGIQTITWQAQMDTP